MSTFVSVGNATQPFPRLLDAVCSIVESLPQPVIMQYGATKGYLCPNCECISLMDMQEFEEQMTKAELLILHAGAGSVIHAVRSGKVPVIMPRHAALAEHVDDHQLEFSCQLEKAGKVLVVSDSDMLLDACNIALSRQNLNGKREGADSQLVGLVKSVLEE